MILPFLGLLFLASLAVFGGFALAGWRRGLSGGDWAIAAVTGLVALASGAYIWAFLNSLTIVTVTSKCAEYAGAVSAGARHKPIYHSDTTDYYVFDNPSEGSVSIEGRNGSLDSYGYVTTFGMERLDFWLDKRCRMRATQTNLEID